MDKNAPKDTNTDNGNARRPRMLFIGHAFHAKTKSTVFFKDIICRRFNVTFFAFDPFTDDPKTKFRSLYGQRYDILLMLQVMPPLESLRDHISFGKCVFVPMFDYLPPLDDPKWKPYKNALIISFSSTLRDALSARGYNVRFIRYFPKPIAFSTFGDPKKVFLWQRVNAISLDTITTLFKNMPITSVHHHKAMDPGFFEQKQMLQPKYKVTQSLWFPKKADMARVMESAAFYIAPRVYEGIGMSFLEAMAMGRCVVAPDNPTMSEYIKNGETGILYNVANPMPMKSFNPLPIQKKALRYIAEGFAQWEGQKENIVKWIEEWNPPTWKSSHSFSLPVARMFTARTTSVFYLFGLLPVLRISACADTVVYWPLCFIPLLLKRKSESSVSFWLFGVIPLWKSGVSYD